MSNEYNRAHARAQKAEVKCKQLRAELERLRAENAKMRAVLDRCAKITADGEWAVAGDWLWYPLGGQPRKFRVDANMTVPVSVPTAGSWRDLAVEEAYFHKENALAAKGANDE